MTTPEWAKYYRVDTILECFKVSRTTAQELLRLADQHMPEGPYGGVPPGEDDWPEPDALRDTPYKLDQIWSKLSAQAREDIAQALPTREAL